MLLGCRKNEYGVGRRFLKSLQEGIECSLREHMHLIYDVYAVPSHLRRYTHLIHQGLDILHTIVGSGVKLMYAVRTAFSERLTRFTVSAWLHIGRRFRAVYHLGEYAGCSCLSYTSGAAEQVGMSQLSPENGVLQGLRDIILTDKCPERIRPVFSC